MKKVGIFYHWFAHYREPIIREMLDTLGDEFEFEFVADNKALEPAMEVLDEDDFKKIASSDIIFSRVKNVSFASFIWQFGSVWKAFTGRYDAIVFLGEFRILSSWPAILLAKLRGSKTFFWSHGVYGNESWFKLRVRLMFYRQADGMLLYGNRSRVLMESMGFAQKNLHVVFNSLNYQNQLTHRKNTKIDKATFRQDYFPHSSAIPVLAFVGRLTKVKDLPLLLKAVQLLCEKNQPVNLLVVGNGPELDTLTKLTEEFEIQNRVHFFGACHDETILANHLLHADICVSPGNVGLLAMHSLAYGTPVITHGAFEFQMPEFEAIVEDRTGGFFVRGELDSLCAVLQNWLIKIAQTPEQVEADCHQIIDRFYNPSTQCDVLKTAFDGRDAKLTPVELAE